MTDKTRGAIGVDLNADHLAMAETDGTSNWGSSWRAPLVTCGKNTNQAVAIIGDAVANVVQYAREAGTPIVMERPDFRQKKAAMEGEFSMYSRMLSSLSYGRAQALLLSRETRGEYN